MKMNNKRNSGVVYTSLPKPKTHKATFSVSEGEAKECLKQNQLVRDYCVNVLKFEPYAISRDKQGHILILEKSKCRELNMDCFNCYLLGAICFDENEKFLDEKFITPYCVGQVCFRYGDLVTLSSGRLSFDANKKLDKRIKKCV